MIQTAQEKAAKLRAWKDANPDKVRASRNKHRKAHSKWVLRNIVAWDGEGCNLGDEQLYVLLANSNGDYLVNRSGITSYQAMTFMCDHSNAKDINVVFGGSYDVNMIVADLPRKNLEELWTTGATRCFGFYIRYQWRRCFNIKRQSDGKSFVLWDVLGFFQATFVKTVHDWLPDEDIEKMASMKAHRPDFDFREIDEIIAYCLDECRLLVRVCDALFDAFDTAGVVLNRYDGAGAAAAARMRQAGVLEHMGHYPTDVQIASRYAYAGGRIEAVQTGHYDGDIERDDINSAYPAWMRTVPCLADGHGYWEHDGDPDRDTYFTMYRVGWDYPPDQPFYPFFYREHDGSVLFPREGIGWCWKPELDAALKWGGLENIGILESWSWHQQCACAPPFDFINEDYERRQEFKASDDPKVRNAQIVVKLWMNSLYGKTAQQLGYVDKAPALHDLCIAGFTTSCTRAQAYDAGMRSPNDVIAFATDAIIAKVPTEAPGFDLPFGSLLGEWSHEEFDGIVMVQAGVYFLREKGKEWAVGGTALGDELLLAESKFRGFDRGTLNREAIVNAWDHDEEEMCEFVYPDGTCCTDRVNNHVHASVTRFVGAGSALASPEWYHRWRHWVTTPRKLSLIPAGKRRQYHGTKGKRYAHGLVRSYATPNMTPTTISTCYPLAWEDDGVSTLVLDQMEGVDIRTMEREEWDSWV